MTGLELETNVILEIASIVTTADLEVLAEGPSLAISHPQEVLEGMDEWNTQHHTQSGLLQEVIESEVSLQEAEAVTYDFVSRYVPIHKSPLCGNTIWQDRRFLAKYMPTLEHYMHYRVLDVSTVKELARRWYPSLEDAVTKDSNHRAMDDIRESINELRVYRERLFVKQPVS